MRFLRIVRKQQGIASKDVADLIGVSLRTYQSYELGSRTPPFEMIEKLEDLFGVSYRDLLKAV